MFSLKISLYTDQVVNNFAIINGCSDLKTVKDIYTIQAQESV